jgi:hypothetical protein
MKKKRAGGRMWMAARYLGYIGVHFEGCASNALVKKFQFVVPVPVLMQINTN